MKNKFNGNCPNDSIVTLRARENEFCLDHKDIIDYIREFGDEIALVLLSGVQYYTGQLFKIEEITLEAHKKVGIFSTFNASRLLIFIILLRLYLHFHIFIFRIASLDGIWHMQ